MANAWQTTQTWFQHMAAQPWPEHGRTFARWFRANWSWRWFAFALSTALGVLLVTGFLVIVFLGWNPMRGTLSRFASAQLGREVHIRGDLNVRLFSWTPQLSAADIRIANADWAGKGDMAQIKLFIVEMDLWSFLHGNLLLPLVQVEQPSLDLQRTSDGRENWHIDSGPRVGAGAHIPPIQHLIVHEGRVRLVDARRKLTFIGTVSSNEDLSNPAAHAFSLTGQGMLNNEPVVADLRGGPIANVDLTKPYPFAADIHAGATHIVAQGFLIRPFDLNAIDASATFTGHDLNELYFLTGLALPNTPPYSATGRFTRNGAIYRFEKFSGRFGSSDLSGDLSVDASAARSVLHGKLASRVLVLEDFGALFGTKLPGARKLVSTRPEKSGTVTLAGVAKTTEVLTLPDASLQIERVRQMDAYVHYDAASVRSRDLPLRRASLDLTLKDGVLTLAPFAFEFARGKLAGSATIDARRNPPMNDVDMRVTGLKLENFVAKAAHDANPPLEGDLEARLKLHGAGISIHKAAANADGRVTVIVPHGKIRKVFAELLGINFGRGLALLLVGDKSDTELRCAVASFSAHGGLLTADRFVVDTDSVLATGKGTINLDDERVSLELQGKPKEFRLFHLSAPILIGGTLGDMNVGVKTGNAVAQTGVAAALAFLTPLAMILPFVDAGLTKDANCTGLMREAQAHGAPRVPKKK